MGKDGSRGALTTPALVLDLDALEHNIAVHAEAARAAGLGCRPHGKTHKSPQIARRQIDAGAHGICCATVKEAETFVAAGIGGVLLTTPVVSPAKIERLAALARRSGDLTVVADSALAVARLAAAAGAAETEIGVLVDLDIAPERTGVRDPDAAIALADAVRRSGTLRYRGVQAYSGMVQHITGHAERAAACRPQLAHLDGVLAALVRQRMTPEIVSGGGTGTFHIDAAAGLFTEHQAGSYCVMDVEYADIALLPDGPNPFRHALFVASSVISANARGHVTTDAGIKAFAMDGPAPRLISAGPAAAAYSIFGDEHGKISCADAGDHFPLGTAIELIVPHCDPTTNLYDHFHCCRGDRLVEIWPIEARGVI